MKYNITVINKKIGYKLTLKDLTVEEVKIVAERHNDKNTYKFKISRHYTEEETKKYEAHQQQLIEQMTEKILQTK